MKLLHRSPGAGLHVRVPVNKPAARYLRMIEQSDRDMAREINRLLPAIVEATLRATYVMQAVRQAASLKLIKGKEAMAQAGKMDRIVNEYIRGMKNLDRSIIKLGKK